MPIRLLDLVKQHELIGRDVENAVLRVLRSGHYILGDEVSLMEREMAERVGVKHAIGVSSGSDALLCGLMALGIGPGDEVVTTALTFFATAGAISRVGARPVFADIDPRTYNLDPTDALRKKTDRTKLFMPVHLFGRPADVAPLQASGIPVFEDAAQALDAKGVGKSGRLAAYSFFPSKNLGAAGDAGMITTDDDALGDRLKLLRTHGSRPKYFHQAIGGNFRIDALQAAVLRAKLPHLSGWNQKRAENARRYQTLLESSPLGLPESAPGHVWHHYVVRAPRREQLREFLKSKGIETEVYYPHPLHLQPCFAEWGGKTGDLPHTEKAAAEVLALPVHPQMENSELEAVAGAVLEFYRS